MRGTRIDVDQRTDFYPYGLAHGSFQNLQHNKYLYGGKEYQDQMLGSTVLGLYDFHARYYNPMYGRWFNIDPALQTTNPYIYCGNSPMMYVDPNGEFWWIPIVMGAFHGGANSMMNGGSFFEGALKGAVAGGIGALAGIGTASLLVNGGAGFIGGAITGAAGGFAGGATGAWLNGANFGQGLKAGLIGGGIGGAMGGLMRGMADYDNGFSFWRGSKITGELLSANIASGTEYDQSTLAEMTKQLQSDAEFLWGIKPGEKGLISFNTVLDAEVKARGYTYNDGMFFRGTTGVDGFANSYSSGKSKLFIAPDVVASRTKMPLSLYTVVTGKVPDILITMLSARYVSTLGHELIHSENWFNGGYRLSPNDYKAYSEHAAYEFSIHVYTPVAPNMVEQFNQIRINHGWTKPYTPFRTTKVFKY